MHKEKPDQRTNVVNLYEVRLWARDKNIPAQSCCDSGAEPSFFSERKRQKGDSSKISKRARNAKQLVSCEAVQDTKQMIKKAQTEHHFRRDDDHTEHAE